MVYTRLPLLKQIANCKCKIFQPNLLVRKFPRKRTIFRKPPIYSLENLRKLSPHQKSYPPVDESEKPAYTWCQLKVLAQSTFIAYSMLD